MLGLENVSLEKRRKIGAGQKVDRGTRLNLILCMQEKVRSEATLLIKERKGGVPFQSWMKPKEISQIESQLTSVTESQPLVAETSLSGFLY